jgi:quercetin dioxygenase-like cupin family protein
MSQTHGTWGERLRTFHTDSALVTLLFLKPNQRCSWHHHKGTYNKFTCVSGRVYILTDKGYETCLYPKQEFTVEPGVKHEFRTKDSEAIVEEIAFVFYDENDIERETIGGPLNAG